jgi:hypothetical protein
VWWADVLRHAFARPLPTIGLEIFRVVFGLALLLKFAVETKRGYFQYFKPRSFLHFQLHVDRPDVRIAERTYKGLYILKLFAALGVVLGVEPRPCLLVLAAWLSLELLVYFKFHANLMLLVALGLLFAPPATLTASSVLANGFRSTLAAAATHSAVPFAQSLLIATMIVLYVATAVHKTNRQFSSGIVVVGTLRALVRTRSGRQHFDGWYPKSALRWLDGDAGSVTRRWGPWMVAVIGFELALPFLLLWEPTFALAALAGIVMHAAFTLLFPATLLHFSVLAVATYLLFLDPDRVARLVLAFTTG